VYESYPLRVWLAIIHTASPRLLPYCECPLIHRFSSHYYQQTVADLKTSFRWLNNVWIVVAKMRGNEFLCCCLNMSGEQLVRLLGNILFCLLVGSRNKLAHGISTTPWARLPHQSRPPVQKSTSLYTTPTIIDARESSIQRAIANYDVGIYPSIRTAARAYSLPWSTLIDRRRAYKRDASVTSYGSD